MNAAEFEENLNLSVEENTLVGGCRFEHAKHIIMHVVYMKHVFNSLYKLKNIL